MTKNAFFLHNALHIITLNESKFARLLTRRAKSANGEIFGIAKHIGTSKQRDCSFHRA
jgi:hypothetical protein